MRMRRIIFIAVAGLLLLGCAGSSKKIDGVQIGMTKQQVVEVMGTPRSTSAIEEIEYLKYRLRSDGLFTAEYYVRLQNGQVDAFGQMGDFGLGY